MALETGKNKPYSLRTPRQALTLRYVNWKQRPTKESMLPQLAQSAGVAQCSLSQPESVARVICSFVRDSLQGWWIWKSKPRPRLRKWPMTRGKQRTGPAGVSRKWFSDCRKWFSDCRKWEIGTATIFFGNRNENTSEIGNRKLKLSSLNRFRRSSRSRKYEWK